MSKNIKNYIDKIENHLENILEEHRLELADLRAKHDSIVEKLEAEIAELEDRLKEKSAS